MDKDKEEIVFIKMKFEDLEFFNEIRNECREKLHNNSYFTLEQTKEWFEKTNPEFYLINYSGNDIGYFRTSNLIENESIYIGADLHPLYRGKGFAYNSYRKFIPFISKKYNLKTILLEVLSNNNIAFNLYKKLEFEIMNIDYNFQFRNNEFIHNIKMKLNVI